MKVKLISFFVLFAFCSHSGFAQTKITYPENLTKLNDWLSDIDSVIVRVKEGETLKKISHQFSYIIEIVGNINTEEKTLVESISKRSEINDENTIQLQPLVSQISGDIDQLYDRVRKIKNYVSETDTLPLVPIIQSLEEISQNKDTIKLNYLTAYLFGEKNIDNKLKEDTKHLKSITEQLVEKLNKAKEKIKAKTVKK